MRVEKDGEALEPFWAELGGEVLRDALGRNCWLSDEFQVFGAGRAQILLLSAAPRAVDLCVEATVSVSLVFLLLSRPTIYELVPVV